MIAIKIDVTKIDKALLFKGAKGTYLNVTLKDNKDGEDQYGNAGFVTQDVSAQERQAGNRGPIIGNWKHVGGKPQGQPASRPQNRPAPPQKRPPAPDPDLDGDDTTVPF